MDPLSWSVRMVTAGESIQGWTFFTKLQNLDQFFVSSFPNRKDQTQEKTCSHWQSLHVPNTAWTCQMKSEHHWLAQGVEVAEQDVCCLKWQIVRKWGTRIEGCPLIKILYLGIVHSKPSIYSRTSVVMFCPMWKTSSSPVTIGPRGARQR